mmetsp:Transcript_9560/g.16052  ORF Transcript_9560/g.16052 Transcript_9560/m.16052 type:complete len:328 (+) Transcript_9560:724-1707(+)
MTLGLLLGLDGGEARVLLDLHLALQLLGPPLDHGVPGLGVLLVVVVGVELVDYVVGVVLVGEAGPQLQVGLVLEGLLVHYALDLVGLLLQLDVLPLLHELLLGDEGLAASVPPDQLDGVEAVGDVLGVVLVVVLEELEGLGVLLLAVHLVPLVLVLVLGHHLGGVREVVLPGLGLLNLLLGRAPLHHDGVQAVGDVLGVLLVVEVHEVDLIEAPAPPAHLGVVPEGVFGPESVVVAVGGELRVVKRLVIVAHALDVFGGLDHIGVVGGLVVVSIDALDSLGSIVQLPPGCSGLRLWEHVPEGGGSVEEVGGGRGGMMVVVAVVTAEV